MKIKKIKREVERKRGTSSEGVQFKKKNTHLRACGGRRVQKTKGAPFGELQTKTGESTLVLK